MLSNCQKTAANTKTTKPRTRSDVSANRGKELASESKGLTARQSLFVAEYLKDQNASASYKRAGYKSEGHSADSAAARLLTKVEIRRAVDEGIAKLRTKIEDETGVTLKMVVAKIAEGAFFDPRKMFNADGSPRSITELEDAESTALAGFEMLEQFEGSGNERVFVGHLKKFKLSERKAYLDMLMKHLGGYEKDNEQKGGALAELLAQVSRSSIPITKSVSATDEGD